MRHRATHLLHVLACAPVAAVMAATLALPSHALAATSSPTAKAQAQKAPTPYVVAIDAGHGGTPDNDKPDQPFDPGVVAANGLQEKDVTLDVARRLASLLRAENVKVVLTRNDDSYVDIGPRMQTAIDAGAGLFVSIHFNSFTDASTGGALILYPNDASLPFAQVMSDSLATGLQSYGIADDGVQSKPDLWVHATMPAVTVEGAYLTNPREADLLTRNDFRDALARSIRDGVDKQAPEIATLDAQITAWNAAHRIVPRINANPSATGLAGAQSGSSGSAAATLLRWVIVLALLAALVRWRRRVAPVLIWAYHAAAELVAPPPPTTGRQRAGARRARQRQIAGHTLTLATTRKADSPLSRPLAVTPRRRSSARRQAVLQRAARPQPTRRSVYDELWF